MSSSAGLVSGADVEREVGVTQFPAYGGEDEPTLATGDASLMRRGGGVPERAPLLQAHSRRSSGTSSDGQSTTKVAGEDELDLEALNALPWWKRPSILWLLAPFALSTLAFGGVMVPKLNLILTLICKERLLKRMIHDPSAALMPALGEENLQCQTPEIQAAVTRFSLYTNLLAGILSAVMSPKIGAISDRFGRTKLIAATTMGMVLNEVVTIVTATWPDRVSVNWLFFGFFLEGIGGSFTSAMALTHSYAADCTPASRRNEVFGYFYGALFTGIAFGPLLAGYIIEAARSMVIVFYLSTIAHLLFVAFLLVVVPESLSRRRQLGARKKHALATDDPQDSYVTRAFRSANLLAPLEILYPTGSGTGPALRRNLLALAAVDTVSFGIAIGSITVVVYYSEYAFGWGNLESSVFVSIVNTVRVAVLILVLPAITALVRRKRRREPEPKSGPGSHQGSDATDLVIIRLALLFDTLGYLGYAVARSGRLFTVAGTITALGSIGAPAMQSALTKHVPPDRTGQVLGAIGLLHALARVVAPAILNLIYSVTVGQYTQTVFVCMAVGFGATFLVSWIIRPHVYWHASRTRASKSSDRHESGDEGA